MRDLNNLDLPTYLLVVYGGSRTSLTGRRLKTSRIFVFYVVQSLETLDSINRLNRSVNRLG